jgi:hypothetical protein
VIDQTLLDAVTPRIVELQYRSREPISVYLDSPGGSILIAARLRALLTAPSHDHVAPCRIIAAVTNQAASAAADLLAFSDYAVAYPGSRIYFHGTRRSNLPEVTAESALVLTQSLRQDNDFFAGELAARAKDRFFFRYIILRARFAEVRSQPEYHDDNDLECFVRLIAQNLSPVGGNILKRAVERNTRYSQLAARFFGTRRVNRLIRDGRIRAWESELLRIILSNRNNEERMGLSIKPELPEMLEEFNLFMSVLGNHANDRVDDLAERWDLFFLDPETLAAYQAASESDKVTLREGMREPIRTVWLLFAAICSVLQEGEFDLTAEDAYWLGLIDEVLGSNLSNYRMFAEFERS